MLGDVAALSAQPTIVAETTPPGRGGVSIIRVSGVAVPEVAKSLLGRVPSHRQTTYAEIMGDGVLMDEGMAVYFQAPNSYTGEDVLELYVHGNPLIVQAIIDRVVALGARVAEPGEFTMRRFLNRKIDLVEAEAVCDLISSDSLEASQAALRSLRGEFSRQVDDLFQGLVDIRKYVEAAIDFSDEDIELLPLGVLGEQLRALTIGLEGVLKGAHQGVLINEGVKVAIIGPANAGKSSLRNRLAGNDDAIVTDIPGTTRDMLKSTFDLYGIRVTLIDTAGFRVTDDPVEKLGIERSVRSAEEADVILWVQDINEHKPEEWARVWEETCAAGRGGESKKVLVFNKADLSPGTAVGALEGLEFPAVLLSLKHGDGLEALKRAIYDALSVQSSSHGQAFSARRRHMDALKEVRAQLSSASEEIAASGQDWLLLAEQLRLAQHALSKITGRYNSDDLLGEIFSDFCIGK